VFVCVLAYTRSLWTTVNALLGIALSFPTAFFFFRVAADSPFVSFLNILVPFVLLGIGCDDVMVMCDAFAGAAADAAGADADAAADVSSGPRRRRRCCQLPPEDCFTERYVSAARAMLATSLTTAVAFGSNVFSFIPPVRALGGAVGCEISNVLQANTHHTPNGSPHALSFARPELSE
jgi:predicted RND superfamily exporter protein